MILTTTHIFLVGSLRLCGLLGLFDEKGSQRLGLPEAFKASGPWTRPGTGIFSEVWGHYRYIYIYKYIHVYSIYIIYLSIYLSIYLAIYLSIHLSIYLEILVLTFGVQAVLKADFCQALEA